MRFISSVVAIAFTLIGAVIINSNQANASATGCDNRQILDKAADPNAISAEISLPYGYLCHLVHNNGKEIKEERAAYASSAGIYSPLVDNICNWRIDFVYYDKKGEEYMRDKGETVSDCKIGASRAIEKSKTLPEYGIACAELYIEDERRFTQCHTITE